MFWSYKKHHRHTWLTFCTWFWLRTWFQFNISWHSSSAALSDFQTRFTMSWNNIGIWTTYRLKTWCMLWVTVLNQKFCPVLHLNGTSDLLFCVKTLLHGILNGCCFGSLQYWHVKDLSHAFMSKFWLEFLDAIHMTTWWIWLWELDKAISSTCTGSTNIWI